MAARAALLLLLAAAVAAQARQPSQTAPKPAAAAKPVPAAVPAGALAPNSLYVQSARRGIIERLQNGEYKLVLLDPSHMTLWFTDRPVREAGIVPHTTFISFLGATKSNPVNAAIATTDRMNKQAIVPILMHDGQVQGDTIVWYGKLMLSAKTIRFPGTVIAEHLKPGQRLEVRNPSLFIDGAEPPTADTLFGPGKKIPEDRIDSVSAEVEAGLERGDGAAAITASTWCM